jgi:hypothetical protein
LLLFVGQAADAEADPVGLLLQHVERLLVAGQQVRIEESSHDLVDGVIRRPDALAGVDAIEEFFRKGRKVARIERLRLGRLHFRQLATRLSALALNRASPVLAYMIETADR